MPDYFTLAELNALPNMSEAKYTDARKEAAAAYVVAIIERVVGTSFVPRTETDEVHDGSEPVVLDRSYIRSIDAVTESGIDITASYDFRADHGSLLRKFAAGSYVPASWVVGLGNIEVTYTYGYSATPPDDVKEAALQATRYRLLATNSNSDIAARTINATTPDGSVQYAVAGQERPTGYPDVDAVIIGWRDRIGPLGVA